MKKSASFVIILAVILFSFPFNSYAYEAYYVENETFWSENEDVTMLSVQDTRIDGIFQYFVDYESNTLYAHTHLGNNAVMSIDSVVRFGITDSNSVLALSFIAGESEFEYADVYCVTHNTYSDIYFAVDFKKEYVSLETVNLKLTVSIDSTVYMVYRSLPITFESEQTATTSAKSNSKSKSQSQTATTKASGKTTKETSTKFKYTPDESNEQSTESQADTSNDDTQENETYTENQIITAKNNNNKTSLTKSAKALLITAAGLFLTGTILIICNAVTPKKQTETDLTPEEEQDEQ